MKEDFNAFYKVIKGFTVLELNHFDHSPASRDYRHPITVIGVVPVQQYPSRLGTRPPARSPASIHKVLLSSYIPCLTLGIATTTRKEE